MVREPDAISRAATLNIATSRNAVGNPFEAPSAIVEVSSASSDDDPWMSADGTYMLLASNRDGNFEVYESSR